MPTIHDLVRALAQREGVEAVVILGRDGLLIDTRTNGDLDGEHLAALTPGIASAAEAILLLIVHSSAHLGALLYDLRRHRANIASLV